MVDLRHKESTSQGSMSMEVGVGNKGVFSVRSLYEKLLIREVVAFRYSSIWISKVPRKVYFFHLACSRRGDLDGRKSEEKVGHVCQLVLYV